MYNLHGAVEVHIGSAVLVNQRNETDFADEIMEGDTVQ